jgi:hypothetical protein
MAAAQTVWTQAITNYLTALNAPGSPATIWRTRFETVTEQQAPALNVFAAKVAVSYEDAAHDSASIEHTTTVRGYVAATDQVDLAADPLVAWAWQRLRVDPTLGQTVSEARVESIEFGYLDKSASDQVCVDIETRRSINPGWPPRRPGGKENGRNCFGTQNRGLLRATGIHGAGRRGADRGRGLKGSQRKVYD